MRVDPPQPKYALLTLAIALPALVSCTGMPASTATPSPRAAGITAPSSTPATTESPPASASPSPSPTPRPPPGRVRVARDVPFTPRLPCSEFRAGCLNLVDVYYPENAAGWPVVVTIHGRPRTRADMAPLARALASRGAVVYNADYRGVRPVARGFPESVEDVACAVRFARTTAGRYGGNGSELVLVGHSQGGYVGALVSLAGDKFPGRPGACLAEGGSPLPDGFVHVAGVSKIQRNFRLDWIYFGGSPAEKPAQWRLGEIANHVGRNRDLVVRIIFERNDPVLDDGHATHLYRALKRGGYDVRLDLLREGSTHFDILRVPGLGERVVRLVQEVVARTRPAAPA